MSAQRRQHMNGNRAAGSLRNRSFVRQDFWNPVIEPHSTEGQMDHLIGEINRVTERGERTLVTDTDEENGGESDGLPDQCRMNKVRYLHSEIDTLERMEILRDLRLGVFDVLVGINLLREGLDIPEVSLVAILDADKARFPENGNIFDPDYPTGSQKCRQQGRHVL